MATGLGAALEGMQEYARARERKEAMERLGHFATYDDVLNDCRNKVVTGLNNGFFGYSSQTSGRPVVITCDRIDIGNLNGLTIRARNYEDQLGITFNNNKLSLDGKVVCDDVKKKDDKASYQKSSDGTYWYTNLKVGEPMTQAEIDRFESVWAEDGIALEDLRLRERIHRKRRERQFAEERAAQGKMEEKGGEQKRLEERVEEEREEREMVAAAQRREHERYMKHLAEELASKEKAADAKRVEQKRQEEKLAEERVAQKKLEANRREMKGRQEVEAVERREQWRAQIKKRQEEREKRRKERETERERRRQVSRDSLSQKA